MPVCFICKYVCACIVCLKERKDMKVREKRSRGEYIDRFVDETIVFELSGWTWTLTVCDFHLVCLFVSLFFSSELNGEPLSQFLSLSFSFAQDLSLFAVMCLFPPVLVIFTYSHTHTHRTDLLTFQQKSSSHHDCMYHMLMANVPPTSGWFTAGCS